METSTLLKIALITSLSALIIGTIALYVSMWFFKNKLLNKNNLKWNENLFFPIIMIGTIIGVGILISSIVPSISSTLKIANRVANDSFYFEAFKFISLSAFIVLACVLIMNYLSTFLIQSLFDKIDIATEIKESRYAYALLFSALIIALSLILKEGVLLISEILIPYENISI